MSNSIYKIAVKVQPNAGKNEIMGFSNDVWRIKVAAPPDKGKANKELIEYLSEVLGLKKDQLTILKGLTSHNKLIAVEGMSHELVIARLTK
jgi:uncharacterized protein (TIGR00251 family)